MYREEHLRESKDEEFWFRKVPEVDGGFCEPPIGSLSSEVGGLELERGPPDVRLEAPICLVESSVKLAIAKMEPGSLMLA